MLCSVCALQTDAHMTGIWVMLMQMLLATWQCTSWCQMWLPLLIPLFCWICHWVMRFASHGWNDWATFASTDQRLLNFLEQLHLSKFENRWLLLSKWTEIGTLRIGLSCQLWSWPKCPRFLLRSIFSYRYAELYSASYWRARERSSRELLGLWYGVSKWRYTVG